VLCAVVAALGFVVADLRAKLAEARQEAELLRQPEVVGEPVGWAPPALVAAGKVVGAVVEQAQQTAQRLRDEGVGGLLWGSLEDFSRWALDQQSQIAQIAAEDGTVTIMFSDIEGSTRLNSTLGDKQWVKVLAAHDELVELYVDKYRGLVVKTQGDGHMLVFNNPQLAVEAALDINRALAATWHRNRHLRRTPISLRFGLHTGTAIERGGDFFGQNVALAARIAAQAEGGEILVSEEVAKALDEDFIVGVAKTVELKGFEGSHTLWYVEGPR